MKRFVTMLLAGAMALSLVACGGGGGTSASSPSGGSPAASGTGAAVSGEPAEITYREHLTIAQKAQVTTLDPQKGTNAVHHDLFLMVFNTPISYDSDTGEFSAEIATEWKWTDDTYTVLNMKLRDDVVFHNGEKMTAEDVAFTMDRVTNPMIARYYDHSEIIGDYELNIHLNAPYVDFPCELSSPDVSIVSKAAVEADPDFGTSVGTGPWAIDLDGYVAGDVVELYRNDDYWGELPKTKTITYRTIADASTRLMALENDEIQFMVSVAGTEIENVKANSKLGYTEWSTVNLNYLGVNANAAPNTAAGNQKIRQAISCAINREAIAAATASIGVKYSESYYNCNAPSYLNDFENDLTYNPEKAKQLVAESGISNPTIKLLSNNSNNYYRAASQVIQECCRQVGITMEIVEVDSAGLLANINAGTFESFLYSISLKDWDGNVGRVVFPGVSTNTVGMDNARINELMDLAVVSEGEKATEYYHEIQEILHEEAYYIPNHFDGGNIAYRDGLTGYILTTDNRRDCSYICMPEG